ncbi:elongation of very long chain fatty acids protein F-like [Drosophila miranda]|uniref:elongation of very long chain fatty acids protein F-like n=1 Tax=Drosophila miranda TaxID=7229 RepID=UPI0007E781B2|nr:elongation of very long chain fatty acids protein F-like [Drosophila miranda]
MFEVFDKPYADPVPLPLVNSAWPLATIIALYLLFVLKLGGQFMARHEALQLRGVLKVYNIVQVLYNTVMLIWGFHLIFVARPYNLSCMTVLPQDHPMKSTERTLSYVYHLNKVLDLMDTVFFVLRKKQRQITFLHVFHHVFMAVTTHLLIRFYGHGGHVYFICMFNVLVHIVMYGYYYASSQSRNLQESLWWKKYLTLTQLVQFLLMFLHCAYTGLQPNCNASRGVIYLICTMSAFMFVMFTNFYISTYIRPKKGTSKGKAQ